MRGIKIITVGKISKGFRQEAFAYYLKKVETYTRVSLRTIKDAKNGPISLRMEKEGERILERIEANDYLLVLDETGRNFTSRDFSRELLRLEEDPGRKACFVVGGAYGLAEKIRSKADLLIGLGPMTLPHELACVILMEQIYRGQTIIRGHPYHH